jgi:hypothetical protein
VNKQALKYIFTTEGHFLKLDKSLWNVDSDFFDMTRGSENGVNVMPRSNASDCGVSTFSI